MDDTAPTSSRLAELWQQLQDAPPSGPDRLAILAKIDAELDRSPVAPTTPSSTS